MKRGMLALIAVLALASLTGCGTHEPAVSRSHHTQPTESARFDAMRTRADEQSPFTRAPDSPRAANSRDMAANSSDANFHAEAENTSPMTYTPER